MLDAPVSGGINGAQAGTLTFMVGGELNILEQSRNIFLSMGKNIIHCGDGGAGEVAKLCNNLALAISMIGTSEAMNLGTKLGMKPEILASVINTSTGRSWSSELYNPYPNLFPNIPSSNNYNGGFNSQLMEKDLFLSVLCDDNLNPLQAVHWAVRVLYLLCQPNGL